MNGNPLDGGQGPQASHSSEAAIVAEPAGAPVAGTERGPLWGLGFSPAAEAVLSQLAQAGLVQAVAYSRGSEGSAESSKGGSDGDSDGGSNAGNDAGCQAILRREWDRAGGFVIVAATGLVTRLLAPLLTGKERDPAVVVVDPQGRYAIPLLGGHGAGAEALSQRVAALLGGTAVLTGASSGSGRLALDAFGRAWGWRRGSGDWRALMQRAARQEALTLQQARGLELWRDLEGAAGLQLWSEGSADGPPPQAAMPLVISERLGGGCRWHPPCLWLGIGCERHTSLSLLERLVDSSLAEAGLAPEAVAGVASIDRKGDEPALLQLAQQRGWPLQLFSAEQLAAVSVPTPSAAVAAEMGTASVAEAAAMLAAGPEAALILPKRIGRAGQSGPSCNHGRDGEPGHSPGQAPGGPPGGTPGGVAPGGGPSDAGPSVERGAATLAIGRAARQWAPQQGALHLVGSGPGQLDLLTGDARQALSRCTVWVGYGLYLDLLEPLRRADQLRLDGRLTEERARCAQALELACQGLPVALVSSGDSGIYAMAGLALELWLQRPADGRPRFTVHPGISALQLAAARAGAPLMHDFCTISLSDRLTPWAVIERRLEAAAAGDFVVALYNPRSLGRDWQLGRARELLLAGRPASTPVAIARELGRAGEAVSLHTLGSLPVEQVDMLTLVLVGNSSSYVRDGRMVTPRGYPGAELS